MIVESGVTARVVATEPTHVLHFGPADAHGPPNERGGTTVHVVGPGGTWAMVDDQRDTRFFRGLHV